MLKKSTEQSNTRMSVIGADMVVEGNIKAKDMIRVEGNVAGNVETEGNLTISSSARVKGNIKGNGIVIGGVLEGDLVCGGKTEVISTGKVFGNIHTRSLIVDENAVFQGQCVMNEEEVASLMKVEEPAKSEENKNKKHD